MVEPTHLKNMSKLGNLLQFSGWTFLKPPPSHFSVIQKPVALVNLDFVGSRELAPTGWYRWWFRNPHFAIVWMCSINPVVNHGICFTRLDGSSKTDVSVNESSSSIAAPVIWSHARRFEGSFSWWPEQDIQDGHLYQCGYRANTCMIMCRNYIDTHIYIHLLKHKYIHWHVYIYILNPHYIFTQIKQPRSDYILILNFTKYEYIFIMNTSNHDKYQ